jgi:methionyl-tRNA formyltransferase
MIKILTTEAVAGQGDAGVLYERNATVLEAGTGSGLLRIMSLHPEGKKPMSAAEFMRGHRGLSGKKFGPGSAMKLS